MTDFSSLQPVLKGAERKFTVVGKTLSEKQQRAGYYLQINEGDAIEGIFQGITINTSGKFKSREISIADSDGNITVVKANASLENQLKSIEVGSPVRLEYRGKRKLTKGDYAGTEVQSWMVYA